MTFTTSFRVATRLAVPLGVVAFGCALVCLAVAGLGMACLALGKFFMGD